MIAHDRTRNPRVRRPISAFDIVSGLIAATIYKVGDIMYSLPRGASRRAGQSRAQPRRRVLQAIHPPAGRTLHAKSAASGSTPASSASRPNTSPRSSSASAGKSVSEWIDNYVILEAKTLLKYSNDEHTGDRLLPRTSRTSRSSAATSSATRACRPRSTRRRTDKGQHPAGHVEERHIRQCISDRAYPTEHV